jgi:hypothetical protein
VRYDPLDVALGGVTGTPIDRAAVPLAGSSGDRQKRFVAVQVALSGQTVNLNLHDGLQASQYDRLPEITESGGTVPASVLAIPLKNSDGVVLAEFADKGARVTPA